MTVSDTGIGMGEESRSRLFQAFSQGDVSTTRRYGGTGLGLAISRELVELMGGTIEVITQPGQGSSFSVTIPFLPGLSDEPSDPMHAKIHDCRVLVIEPHLPTRESLELALDAVQVKYDGTGTVAEGQVLLQRARMFGDPYDFILIAPKALPGEIGTFRQSLRMLTDGEGPLVILLTTKGKGEGGDGEVDGLIRLSKPVRRSRLYNCIRMGRIPHNVTPVESSRPKSPAGLSLLPDGVHFNGRILLAEDNPINQRVVLGLLKKMGVTVDIAANGREAVAAVVSQSYDLVFMDWQMPEMDGLEATRIIREQEMVRRSSNDAGVIGEQAGRAIRVPIVAMTANAMDGDREQCIAAGMDEYLPKPIRRESLLEILSRWIPRKQDAEGHQETQNSPTTPSGNKPRFPMADEGLILPPIEVKNPTHCDWGTALEQVDGDTQLLGELIDLFEESAPVLLRTIRDALTRQDYSTAGKSAHTLIGAIGTFRARSVAETASRFECAAEQQNLEDLEELIEKLDREITQLRQELQAYLTHGTRKF